MRRRLAAVFTLLALAACGNQGEEYREQANALCREAERDGERLPPPQRPEDLPAFLDRLADTSREYDRRSRELKPPEDLRKRHDQSVQLGVELIDGLERLSDQLRESKSPASTLQRGFTRLAPLLERGNNLARDMGLKDCVQELPGPGTAQPESS